jgi:hypothetical protein
VDNSTQPPVDNGTVITPAGDNSSQPMTNSTTDGGKTTVDTNSTVDQTAQFTLEVEQIYAKYDLDKDGALSKDELIAAIQGRND